jgi:Flp pilus assembly pilin Flp
MKSKNKCGQTLIEYAILVLVIGLAVATIVAGAGERLSSKWQQISDGIDAIGASTSSGHGK